MTTFEHEQRGPLASFDAFGRALRGLVPWPCIHCGAGRGDHRFRHSANPDRRFTCPT